MMQHSKTSARLWLKSSPLPWRPLHLTYALLRIHHAAGIKAAQHDFTPVRGSGEGGGEKKRKKTKRPVNMVNAHMAAIEAQYGDADKGVSRDESNPFRAK